MKNFFRALALMLMFITFLLNSAHSQGFNSISTTDGINIIAVGNSGKYYMSSNGGSSWSRYYYGIYNMNSVTGYGNDVWIAANNGMVYKSLKTDNTISEYSTGSSSNLNSVYFLNSNTGFVCGDGGSVYRTDNGGSTWTAMNSGIPSIKLSSISFRDGSNGVVVGEAGAIYVTADGGNSWNVQTSGTTRNLLKVRQFNDSAVAVGEYGTLLLYDGAWTSVNSKTKTDIRGITGTSMSDVHVCGGGGFIRNNINSPEFLNFENNPMMGNLTDIAYYNNNGWAVSSLASVIIYTTDGGSTWGMPAGSTVSYAWENKLSSSNGIGNNLCEHPTDRNTMFVAYGNKVYVSHDRCETWTNISTISGGSSAHSFYVSPVDTNVWLVAITSSPDKVKRTTDYGATWTDVLSLNFSNYGQPMEMDQNIPGTFYFAPDGGGFWKSTDNGASFTEISGSYPFRSPCDIVVMFDSSEVIYVADGVTSSGLADIFKSTNNGVNWTKVHTNASSSEIPSMCVSAFDQSVGYATNWSGGNFYKTTNYGSNWFLLSTQPSSGWGSDLCHEDPALLLKGTYGSPTYLSTNAGANFTSISLGGGVGAGIIVPERGYLIAQQGTALFKMRITYKDSVQNFVPKYLSEDFSNGFPPDDWSFSGSGSMYWLSSSVSSYGIGTGSAKYNFFDSPNNTNQSFVSPQFITAVTGDSLTFDVAYAPYTSGTDSLIIETSTNNGSSFTALVRLYGRSGATGPNVLNTAPTSSTPFTPNSTQWATRKYSIDAGVNKIRFRARSSSGNNLYIDKIKIGNYMQLNLKASIQGFYNGGTLNMKDTVRVYLRNTIAPFAKVDSAVAVLDSATFTAQCLFTNASGGTYYIQLAHRNSIETWSKSGGEVLSGTTMNYYDFTSTQTQTYGGNSIQTGSRWSIYSGDVNSEGAIDISDIIIIFNDASVFNSGYIVTDLNGDYTADLSDILIAFNNSSNFVVKITPETSPSDIKALRDNSRMNFEEFKMSMTGNSK